VIGHVIGGDERPSADGATFPDVDPWTQATHDEVALGGDHEAALAVDAARRAFDDGPWPRMSRTERGAVLHRWADLVEAHADEVALADVHDVGKVITDACGTDVPRSVSNIRFFADHARLAADERFAMDGGHHAYTSHDPAGVVVAIAPWNFPAMQATWKVAPALAWGNTVVLKPAEDSPTSATLLARLALEAGLPAGVLNVVHGFGPDGAGAALTRSPDVDRITFTGESSTGRAIMAEAARTLTPVSLELGGKGANVVFADCDLDEAVRWSVKAIFSNAGQVCLSGSRLLVERSCLDEFVERFVAAAGALAVGDPRLPVTEVGPLASRQHFDKVRRYVQVATDDGGEVLTGGARTDGSWVVDPTVVVGLEPSSAVWREEIFGPVVAVVAFDGEDEAVALANDTPYGLSAMCFTEDLRRGHRLAARLRAGNVWVNCFYVRDLRTPFGGRGDSGIGREGGLHSREFFTDAKSIVMQP
jgi:aminomuconate-semialdehyde/2-hydroxymuconate-6-semialdehyde dehydrogenase